MTHRLLICCGFLVCGIWCQTASAASQAKSDPATLSGLPIVPMNVRFRFVPQYFVQQIENDPKYSRIEALLDNDSSRPRIEIILADKTTGTKAVYSNSEETVKTLQRSGKTASQSVIQFTDSAQTGSISNCQIAFRDAFGEQITWTINVDTRPSQVKPRIMSRPNNSGLVLMRLDEHPSAMLSANVVIGGTPHPMSGEPQAAATENQNSAPGTFYGTSLRIAEIMPGAELWRVDSYPKLIETGQKWTLHTGGGESRVLTIENVSDDEIILSQMDNNVSVPIRLGVRLSHAALALQSLSASNQSHFFQITFDPELPLPTEALSDSSEVSFKVAEDGQPDIASGKLLIHRRFGDENLDWKIDFPDWARAHLMQTGATVLNESAGNRTKVER